MPGRASERQLANVSATDPARSADASQPLVNLDWQPATAFAAPQDKPLTVSGVEIDTAKASKTRFGSPEEFIATMMPMAEKAARRLGVEPRYLVAQAALETGWGKSMIRQKDGSNSHNLFGIKATNWSGEPAMARTTEYLNGRAVKQVEGFRAYASFEQSFDDFVSLLQKSERYQSAVNAGGDSNASCGSCRKPAMRRTLSMRARSARSRGAWKLIKQWPVQDLRRLSGQGVKSWRA